MDKMIFFSTGWILYNVGLLVFLYIFFLSVLFVSLWGLIRIYEMEPKLRSLCLVT